MKASWEGEDPPSRASSMTGQEAEVAGRPGEARESWGERKGQRWGVNPSEERRSTQERQLAARSELSSSTIACPSSAPRISGFHKASSKDAPAHHGSESDQQSLENVARRPESHQVLQGIPMF